MSLRSEEGSTRLEMEEKKIIYDGSIDGSEFHTLFHMLNVISRYKNIPDHIYRRLDYEEIKAMYNRIRTPIHNINPIELRRPVCICLQNICSCISILSRNILDTSRSVTCMIYGTSESCDKYVNMFNLNRRNNIDKFHNILRLQHKRDSAFQLIAIKHEEMFYRCGNIPDRNSESYASYVEKVFQNIIRVFHRDIGYKAYMWILSMFKTYNFYEGNVLQLEPYICPTWDMFGKFTSTKEDNIRILRFSGTRDYRYYSGFDHRIDQPIDYGFIKKARALFYDGNNLNKNRKLILQVLAPDNTWVENKRDRYFSRYSDIQIGYSVKEKIQIEELPIHAMARGLNEEIDMVLTHDEVKQAHRISKWGKISLFKLDISNMNKIPQNPFN